MSVGDDDNERPTDEERLWLFADRMSAGEVGPEEAEEVRVWLADPARVAMVADLEKIRAMLGGAHEPRDAGAAWRRLRAELDTPSLARVSHASPPRATPRVHFTRRRNRRSWLVGAVASVVIAGPLAYAALAARRSRASAPAAVTAAAPRVFTAQRGQRAQLQLSDGTRVFLAADSRLTVPSAFDSLARQVLLEGEAYFDVIHDSRKPFVVHVRNAIVRDLGTRFSVRAYPTDSAVHVMVTHGAVRLTSEQRASDSGAVVEHGSLAQIDSAGVTSVRTGADTLRYVGWASGILTFNSTPLRDVVAELGRWYDVDLSVADSALNERRITARIDEQPLPRLLDQLSIMLDVRVDRAGRRITLIPLPR